MNAGPGSLGAEALLAHQDFVLALARSLLRDEDAARDVAQETWLAALARPPRSIASLRAWLARVARSRAGDRQRAERRRAEHERMAARAESDDSSAELRERLTLQHRVVEAVLALREPYRATILRHYYEGLSAVEIARREGIPAGTVRARISRAHDLLRDRLDADFDGARAAWVGALAAVVDRVGGPAQAASLWIAGGGLTAAAAVVVVRWIGAGEPALPVVLAESPGSAVERTSDLAEPALEAFSIPETRAPAAGSNEAAALVADPQKREKAAGAGVLANGGFEAKAVKGEELPGWEVIVGATNGAEEPLSTLKLETKEKREGRASLFLSGDDTTRAWRTALQVVPARPGGTYRVRAWAKVKDVRQETVKGTSIRQFMNCFVGFFLLDDNGEVVARDFRTPGLPTSGWQELAFVLEAPDTARKAQISVSLTMSGSLWVDEVDLQIEGGNELPSAEVLVDEGFEKGSGLPAGWEEVVGATNGSGSARSTIAVDRKGGAGGSRASLRFSGEATTIKWYDLQRRFDAAPGDTLTFRAMVRAKDVRKEGIQFQNLHVRLAFFDEKGETVGAAKHAHPGTGTYDWKEASISAVAPEGAVSAMAGIFLSMSGDAWFDNLEIERRPGGRPAYADWLSLETRHLLLRYPKDHPRAKSMAEYGEKLDRAYEDIVKRLGVEYSERISAFLYRDAEQGKSLTGRDLDFANPEGKAVHQRPNSTIGHEMVHCIALPMGYSQTGLLGEGIAVYLNGSPPEEHHKVAAELLAKGELPSMKALVDEFRGQKDGYPAAGSFCGYVVETYGIEKFKELYPAKDLEAGSTAVLGKSLGAVDEDWRAFLKRRG